MLMRVKLSQNIVQYTTKNALLSNKTYNKEPNRGPVKIETHGNLNSKLTIKYYLVKLAPLAKKNMVS